MGGGSINTVFIVAPHYNYFIKGQVDALASIFPETEFYVFLKYNPLVEVISRLPLNSSWIRYARNFSKRAIIPEGDMPDNVHPILLRIPYLKLDRNYPELGNRLYKEISSQMTHLNVKPDLIHSHFIYHYGTAGVLLKRETGAPLVVTAHGDDVYLYPFRSDEWFDRIRRVLDTADHVITVSHGNKEIITKKLGVPLSKVSVIPNGFDSKLFHPMDRATARKKLGLPLDKKILLNVASLVPIKGHSYLLHAMTKAVEVRDDVLLVIVGDGPLRKDLEKQVKNLGLESHVKFAGSRPHSEIPLWMNAADLFVLPSLSEGNPTVMFEALGVGLPFVGTTVGGVPEIITSEDYGLLCPPADPECLAEKILIALDKEWDRERIRKYAEQFTWEKVARQIRRVYNEVIASRE